MLRLSTYLLNVAISVDQLANTILGGDPDETISSRAGKYALSGNPIPARVINALFFWQEDHSRAAIEWDEGKRPMLSPAEARKIARHHSTWVDGWRWSNFSPSELACKGTGLLHIEPELLDKLEKLRAMLGGKPIIINSAYRTPERNRAVGGASQSYHMRGAGLDINMVNHDPHEFERAALAVGFNGLKRYPARGFMHLDIREGAQWIAGNPWPDSVGEFNGAPEIPPSKGAEQAKGGIGGVLGTGGIIALIQGWKNDALSFFYGFGNLGLDIDPMKIGAVIAVLTIAYLAYRYLWNASDNVDEPSMPKASSSVVIRSEQSEDGAPTLRVYAPDGTQIKVIE